jgi:hypothetical protein
MQPSFPRGSPRIYRQYSINAVPSGVNTKFAVKDSTVAEE